jgi:hypothetical protein
LTTVKHQDEGETAATPRFRDGCCATSSTSE